MATEDTVEKVAVLNALISDDAAIDRFWLKVRDGPRECCWPWLGTRNRQGYGSFSYLKTSLRSHRASWAIANGKDPSEMLVCHSCDNPACCNPSHLFLGSHRDNMRDMAAKGRWRRRATEDGVNFARGEKCARAKLTAETIREIRRRYEGGEKPSALGEEFGVHRTAIWQIAKRKVWAHV